MRLSQHDVRQAVNRRADHAKVDASIPRSANRSRSIVGAKKAPPIHIKYDEQRLSTFSPSDERVILRAISPMQERGAAPNPHARLAPPPYRSLPAARAVCCLAMASRWPTARTATALFRALLAICGQQLTAKRYTAADPSTAERC